MNTVPKRVLIILVVFFLEQTNVFAAPEPPPPSTPPPPPGLPLDGALYILVMLSVCYGIYKLNQIKSIKKASN
ncbi:hypothetical protein [Flavobacterium sp.]|uniref:hypothetical protein n=1 Tax=Flavobacterium sp. TaxID=239 RepID=UPI00248968DB|nr:hypothetical protein [Flavobacterium sp.]MDI1316726.1 hypothetical protein [Flavobacterium sp.]